MNNTMGLDVPALQSRVTNILKDPKREWVVIEAEQTTTEQLYRRYIAPLAAIPAVCGFIGMTLVGVSVPFVGTYRESIPRAFVSMVVTYVLSLVGVYVAALIVNKLAPTFDSRPDQVQALKIVAYAQTPSWIAGVLSLVPVLAPLGIVAALYAIYLFYLGLPVLMKTPQAKVIPYMVVCAVVGIVLWIVIATVSVAVTGVASL